MFVSKQINNKIIEILKRGGIGILPTDTIYGLVGLALNKKTIRRIYRIRRRSPKKPFIVLINSLRDLDLFEIRLDERTKKILRNIWPKAVSVILSCPSKRFFYLHRGTKTLAFRLPKKPALRNLLKQTGPLVVPSVNPEGLKPATTIGEAKKYFNKNVEFYVDAGKITGLPSTLIRIKNRKISVLRQGSIKL